MPGKNRRPKREFRPQAHAALYLIALLYVAYLLFQMVMGAVRGGPDAPASWQLALGVAVLGGGAALLGVLTWHMLRLPPKDAQNAPGPDSFAGEKIDEKVRKTAKKPPRAAPGRSRSGRQVTAARGHFFLFDRRFR